MIRREAIKNTLLTLGGLSFNTHLTSLRKYLKPMNHILTERNIGIQLFTIPHLVDQDLKGTLTLLSEIGYNEIEYFGPYPFSAEATKQQWNALKGQMGLENDAFYGYSIDEVAEMMRELRLTAPSMHADILTMRNHMTAMLDEISKLGSKYIVIPALFEGRDDLDGYKALAEEFNSFGEQMSKYGMKFVYHNHGYEHIEMDGQIPMNFLIENTDPQYVQFELDIFWMSAAGANPVEYLNAYPGRYKLLHIKDASEKVRFSGDGGTPDQWMAAFPKMSDPGDGVFDIEGILNEATKSGVEHFLLERDLAPDPMATLNNSYKYLKEI